MLPVSLHCVPPSARHSGRDDSGRKENLRIFTTEDTESTGEPKKGGVKPPLQTKERPSDQATSWARLPLRAGRRRRLRSRRRRGGEGGRPASSGPLHEFR